jgi:flagellar biosynthesis protein FliR
VFEFVNYSIEHVYGFSLVMIRFSGLCVVSPIFGGEQVPKQLRALLALAFAFVVYPVLQLRFDALPGSPFEYLIIVLGELVFGLLIGFLATAIFYGFEMGGRYISIHMGLSMGRTLDPFSNTQTTVIGQIFNMMVIATFLVLNAHHFILHAMVETFRQVPPAQVVFSVVAFDEAIKTFNIVIVTSLKVAMPTMAALFAVNVVFGFIARLVPKMNVFILALPAKISAGVIIVIVALPAILYLFCDVVEKVFHDIHQIIRVLS